MKKAVVTAVVLVMGFLAANPAGAKVKIAGQSTDSEKVCPAVGNPKCIVNNVGTTTTYVASSPKFITLDANDEPMVEDYLGHLFNANMANGQPFCHRSNKDVIREFAESKGIPYTRERSALQNQFHVVTKASSVLGAGAGIDAAKLASEAGVLPADQDVIAAAINAGFNKTKNKRVEVSGLFRYYEINPAILTEFNSDNGDPALMACKKWLKDNNEKLTWTLTGYRVDKAEVTSDFTSTFKSKLEAAAKGKLTDEQVAKITAEFTKTVEQKAEATLDAHFGLLTIGRAPA